MLKNRFFEVQNTVEEKEEDVKSSSFTAKYLLAHYEKVENLERNLSRLPSPEEFFFLQTSKQFNAFTFIPFILKTESIKELFASTYSISVRVVESLMELHDRGMIEKITLLVSDSLIKRNPVTIDKIEALANARANMEVKYTWNHSKITLAETQSGFYIIEGSGNWSENAAIEQYIFANSKGLFDFRKEIFEQ